MMFFPSTNYHRVIVAACDKFSRELYRPDQDLRLLVGHAGVLDLLVQMGLSRCLILPYGWPSGRRRRRRPSRHEDGDYHDGDGDDSDDRDDRDIDGRD